MTVEIVHGSCLDFEASWAKDFSLLYCDPPYSEYVHSHAVSGGMCQYGVGPRDRDFGFDHLSAPLLSLIHI